MASSSRKAASDILEPGRARPRTLWAGRTWPRGVGGYEATDVDIETLYAETCLGSGGNPLDYTERVEEVRQACVQERGTMQTSISG